MPDSGLAESIADEEVLARFLLSDRYFKRSKVLAAAFLPQPASRETSVSRHDREPIDRLWEIGRVVAATSGRNLKGAAFVTAAQVRAVKLTVFPDEPPPRHAAIRNWPWFEGDEDGTRSAHLEIATKLAEAAGAPLLVA